MIQWKGTALALVLSLVLVLSLNLSITRLSFSLLVPVWARFEA